MIRVFIAIIVLLISTNCAVQRQVPINNYQKDTVVVKELIRDTIIVPKVEREYIEVKTNDTISILNTKLATSTASITNNQLQHSLEQKDVEIPVKIQYKDRIVEKVKVEHKEIAVDVPVPYRDNVFWISIIINIVLGGLLIIKILRALKLF